MKMTITNNSRALQGVHSADGLVFIDAGQTRTVDVAESYVDRVKALPFLGIEGVARDFTAAPNLPPPAVGPLDHDGDGQPGGAAPNDPPSERDDLKKQADELGIEYAKNIPTEKLKTLIDEKLAG